jgi:hypothetical protein
MSSPEHEGGFLRKVSIVAVGGLAAFGALTAYNKAADLIPGLPDFPELHFDFGNNPPAAEASVLPETYETEETFDISCLARVGVGVAVHGNKDELIGGGEYDKILFGDFLLCGDRPGDISAKATIERDKATDKPVKVSLVTDGLKVTQPRLDHTDSRNCAPLRTGDSPAEIRDKIERWERDQRKHKDPECDDGFHVSGLGGGSDLSKIKETAFAAAQIAMALDAQPQSEIDELNKVFVEKLKEEIASRYPGAVVDIELTTTDEQIEQRLETVAEDLQNNFFEVELDDDEMKISAPGGGDVTVAVSSLRTGGVSIGRIAQVIEEQPTPRGME